MQVRELLNTCKAAMPVVIGMTDYNRHGAPCYTTARYRSTAFVTGPILSAYVWEWYISEGHIMIEASTLKGGNHGKE